jgi:hypothetical protein
VRLNIVFQSKHGFNKLKCKAGDALAEDNQDDGDQMMIKLMMTRLLKTGLIMTRLIMITLIVITRLIKTTLIVST